RAAALDERDRLVEVDLERRRERDCVVAREARAHELGGAPALHALDLGLNGYFLCRRHPQSPFHTFGIRRLLDLPLRGDLPARLYGTRAEQVAHGGEEVRLRVDAVVRAQLQ